MGNLCGKGKNLEVKFNSQKKTIKHGYTNYEKARQWIKEQFPSLMGTAFQLRAYELGIDIENEKAFHSAIKKSARKVKIEVIKLPSAIVTQLLNQVGRGVFNLRQKNLDIEGLGILVSPNYAITTSEQLRDPTHLKEYTAVFSAENNREIEFKVDGIFISLGQEAAGHFVLAELNTPDDWKSDSSRFIKLNSSVKAEQGSLVKICYCNRELPQLREQEVKVEEIAQEGTIKLALEGLKEGSSGAPIFNSQGELIGLYSNYLEEISAIGVSKVIHNLKSIFHNSTKTKKAAIKEVLDFSEIELNSD
mmetsp:Transcript_14956/g.21750  ORF Transcript_14956/g.21750 Transcript_14956/m.21750 type:complete len:305 (-) Transcript_14956:23-937(-)